MLNNFYLDFESAWVRDWIVELRIMVWWFDKGWGLWVKIWQSEPQPSQPQYITVNYWQTCCLKPVCYRVLLWQPLLCYHALDLASCLVCLSHMFPEPEPELRTNVRTNNLLVPAVTSLNRTWGVCWWVCAAGWYGNSEVMVTGEQAAWRMTTMGTLSTNKEMSYKHDVHSFVP